MYCSLLGHLILSFQKFLSCSLAEKLCPRSSTSSSAFQQCPKDVFHSHPSCPKTASPMTMEKWKMLWFVFCVSFLSAGPLIFWEAHWFHFSCMQIQFLQTSLNHCTPLTHSIDEFPFSVLVFTAGESPPASVSLAGKISSLLPFCAVFLSCAD